MPATHPCLAAQQKPYCTYHKEGSRARGVRSKGRNERDTAVVRDPPHPRNILTCVVATNNLNVRATNITTPNRGRVVHPGLSFVACKDRPLNSFFPLLSFFPPLLFDARDDNVSRGGWFKNLFFLDISPPRAPRPSCCVMSFHSSSCSDQTNKMNEAHSKMNEAQQHKISFHGRQQQPLHDMKRLSATDRACDGASGHNFEHRRCPP